MSTKTIQIDPSLNTYPHNYMTTTYESARRDRFADVIGDYITDENVSAESFYDDLVAEIDAWIKYHKEHLDKCNKIKSMVNNKIPDRY